MHGVFLLNTDPVHAGRQVINGSLVFIPGLSQCQIEIGDSIDR